MDIINPVVRRWTEEAAEDPEGFWARAAEQLPWFRKWDQVFDWDYPTFRWFVGAETNLSYNCLDHHIAQGWGGAPALVYFNERGEQRKLTYSQMHHDVVQLAAALRGMGIVKGDRITIYMPVCPEAIALMLAAARIGAVHVVVFAGFGAVPLADRVRASGSRLIFASDITYRKGKDIPLKGLVDEAADLAGPTVEHVIVHNRSGKPLPMTPGRDLDWYDFLERGAGQDSSHAVMEANEPLFILATSGTTAKPKLPVHTHGGYGVYIYNMGRWVFGLEPSDVWWATSDIGWVVGHSYIVYGPLLHGCTTLAYEGSIDYPEPGGIWRAIDEFGVTGLFTSPTAARLLMRYGEQYAEPYDLSSLKRVVCAGEVLNPPAWEWLQKTVLHDRVPVLDNMWQTETGGPIFGNPYGVSMLPIKPGSAGIPLAGIDAAVVNSDGSPCPPGEKGIMAIRRPFPGLTPTLWGEPERYAQDYWERISHAYYTGDAVQTDEDGYVWFSGRADEIIKIAGHRIGTIEVESTLLKHPAVVEAAVVGRPDEMRGEVISAFVVLRDGYESSAVLFQELIATVRHEFGPVAVIGEINFVRMLPKTRSGKLMRRVLQAIVLDREPGDVTTIEDIGSVEEARHAWLEMHAEIMSGASSDQPQVQ